MSNDQQPSFLGGLPPRNGFQGDSANAAARTQMPEASVNGGVGQVRGAEHPGKSNTLALVAFIGSFFVGLVGIICGHIALKQIRISGERGRGFALAGTIIGYVNVAAWTIGLLIVVVLGSLAGAAISDAASDLESEIAASQEQAAAEAEEIIAEGGGAVQGHAVSPELCAAIDGFVALGTGAVSSMNVTPELLAAVDVLAAVPSPNQPVYQGFANLLKDPASVASIADAQAAAADFGKAAQADLVTCM